MSKAVLLVSVLAACGGSHNPAPADPTTSTESTGSTESTESTTDTSDPQDRSHSDTPIPHTTEIEDPSAKEAIEWAASKTPGMDMIGSAALVLEPGKMVDIPFGVEAGGCYSAITYAKSEDLLASFVFPVGPTELEKSAALGPLSIIDKGNGSCWKNEGQFPARTLWLRLSSEKGGPAAFQLYMRKY